MEYSLIVAKQVIIMFILIGVGIITCKKEMITVNATRYFSNFLLTIVTPCLLINAYIRPFNKEVSKGLLLAFGLSIIFHILATLLVKIFIKKRNDKLYCIERMGAVYSNCGFMAFPLLYAILKDNGIFYGTAFVTVFNLFLWSNGRAMLSDWKSLDIKKVIFNPGTIGTIMGLICYFSQIQLPQVAKESVSYLASLNTPLSMIITGVFLAQVNIKDTIKDIKIYKSITLRLVLFPILMLTIIKVMGVSMWFDSSRNVAIAVILCSACPAAASVILMSSKMNMDDSYGAEILAMSTMLSVITLPVITMLATYI